jgi:hypothetical protein
MSKIRVLSEDGAIRFVDKLKAWCKATFALINHTHDAATQSSAGFLSSSDKTKLDGLNKVTVDSALSTTSTNPVQNKVINNALANKSDITHTHSYAGSSTAGGAATSANKLNTNAGSTSTPVYFTNGVPTACTSITANSATTASKLGTSTVGSSTNPIYLSSGTAKASTSTVGSSTKPIYMSSGTLTASSSTVGSSTKPVYLAGGTITECDSIPYKKGMPLSTSDAADYYVSYKKLLYDSTSGTNSKVTCNLALNAGGRYNWITIYYGSSSGTRRLSTKVYLGMVSSSTTTRNIPLSFNTVAPDYTLLIYASQWSCSVSSVGYMTLSCTYNKTYNHCTKTAAGSNEIYIYRIEGEGST